MHVFLTGERQIGKSRALNRAAEMLGMPCRGFRTRFLTKERGSSSLYMLPAEEEGPLDEDHLVARLEQGRLHGLTERFDLLGSEILRKSRENPDALILMDECGHLEKSARVFQREILRCLDGDQPVLGILRKNQEWHAFIRQHPRVKVLEVNEDNRHMIAETVVSLISQEEK